MSTQHVIHGKLTTHGHMAHYIDDVGKSHAALLTGITAQSSGEHHADLHVFFRGKDEPIAVRDVPYSPDGEPHTWQHLPY